MPVCVRMGVYVRGRTGACGAVFIVGHTWADVVLGDVCMVYMGYMGVVVRCWVVFFVPFGFLPDMDLCSGSVRIVGCVFGSGSGRVRRVNVKPRAVRPGRG